MSRRILVVVAVLLLAPSAQARRILLGCRQGLPGTEIIRGLRPGERSYPFCGLASVDNPDACRFAFCPSLEYVLGCSLNPACLEATIVCSDLESSPTEPPELTEKEEFLVPLRAGRRPGKRVLERLGRKIVLKCRPGAGFP